MVKIVVYEDDVKRLIDTYGSLHRWGEVHVRYRGEINDNILGPLSDNEFNTDFVRKLFLGDKPPKAELYFVGELGGDCLKFAQSLPKDRTYLVLEDKDLLIEVEKNHHSVINPERVSSLVARLINLDSERYY